MAEGNNNHGGYRPGAGNPGYGTLHFIKEKVVAHSSAWWEKWEGMINSDNTKEKQFAMTEFNKLQVKFIPTTLNGDDEGGALQIVIKRAGDMPTPLNDTNANQGNTTPQVSGSSDIQSTEVQSVSCGSSIG